MNLGFHITPVIRVVQLEGSRGRSSKTKIAWSNEPEPTADQPPITYELPNEDILYGCFQEWGDNSELALYSCLIFVC